LIGYVAFKDRGRTSLVPPIIKDKVSRFILPDDPSFPGIDSVIELNDGTMLPISSKFGIGAKASFFSNLLPKGVMQSGNIIDSNFKDIVKTSLKLGFTTKKLEAKQGAKPILYNYSINVLLALGINKPLDIFQDIKKNRNDLSKMKPLTISVLEKIQNMRGIDKRIINELPLSLTSFFSRMTADQLNKDKKSMEEMKRILSGKNFWQANLNISDWKKGTIRFNMTNTKKVKLIIIGNKSAIKDIDAKQGLVNYEIKAI